MENADEKDLEDEDVDEKRGVHEDIENGFVDPNYLDCEWEYINDYYVDYDALSALIKMT